jgi:hypothetical protein
MCIFLFLADEGSIVHSFNMSIQISSGHGAIFQNTVNFFRILRNKYTLWAIYNGMFKQITVTIETFAQYVWSTIWGVHGSDYEECRLLGYKNSVRTSQETYYVSATKSSQLMLCKIWGVHGSDYEECRLLGYKNSVRTSQETHYVSATESSQLMLCQIWGFHGSDYEESRLLGCYAVRLL